jgi:hypothetical protein
VRAAIAPVAFFRPELAFANAPAGFLPSQFSRPEHIEFNRDFIQYTTCPNSVPLRQLALAHVEQQLTDGAAGLFVDNGYRDDVAEGQRCESPLHAHAIAPSPTGAQSFLALLLEVYTTIKRRRPDGWLIVNSGVPDGTEYAGLALSDVSDAQLWESYLRSSHNREPEHRSDWALTHARSIDLERRAAAHAAHPVRTITLSYPWNRDEAFFCYATAKLSQLPWAASLGDRDPLHRRNEGFFGTYPELIGARLGAALRDEPGGVPMGAVWVRELEHGLVVVNPTSSVQQVAVAFTGRHRYRELFSQRDAEGARFSAELPPESGRVLVWR